MNNLLLLLFTLAGLWYLGWRCWAFIWLEKKPTEGQETPDLHVLICARNAGKLLASHLPEWLEQNYPGYQVWVVNDASSDETEEVLSQLAQKYKHLHLLTLSEKMEVGKRAALAFGLAHLPDAQVVLTDADCRPSSPLFLKELASQIGEAKVTYVGLGLYEAQGHGVQAMVQFETMQTAYLYYGAAAAGLPYMGVGRNMGYATSSGIKMVAASAKGNVAGGDDDLSISSGLGGKIQLIRGKAAWTLSTAPGDVAQWWNQKSRHYQTSVHYPFRTLLMLGLDQLSHTLLWLLGLSGFLFPETQPLAWISLGILGTVWGFYAFSLYRRGIKINLFKIGVGDFICTFVLPILWLQAILWKPQGRWT